MNELDRPSLATPPEVLERQIMDSNVPKNEREWWATHEIERLREKLSALPVLEAGTLVAVPREPTEAMLRAIIDTAVEPLAAYKWDQARECWAAMLAAAPASPTAGWEGIASAPKDGTTVDLWIVGPDSTVDFYCPATARKIPGQPLRHGRATEFKWQQRGPNPPNWYPVGGLGMPLSPEVTATHWRPLPAPPLSAKEG